MSEPQAGLYPTPTIPVSWGELVDKITILELKAERIKDEGARANVAKELVALLAVGGAALASDTQLAAQKATLKRVNAALWDIEDALRAHEARGTFDQAFVALARSVYGLNDERAAIKRAINAQTGSQFVEEKSYRDPDS
jgi:hypothetical protein